MEKKKVRYVLSIGDKTEEGELEAITGTIKELEESEGKR